MLIVTNFNCKTSDNMFDDMHSTECILTTRYLDRESNLVVSAWELAPSDADTSGPFY